MSGGSAAASIRTLVVDDDFMVARLHSSIVARQPGFELVGVANSGSQALTMVKEHRPDLILLDVYLPDLTGFEVLRRLRGAGIASDVIVISAARDLESLRQAMQSGVYQYLVKPFELDELRRRLEEYARHFARMRSGAPDEEVAQDEADRLFRGGGARPRTSLPKGISAETIALVRTALERAGGDGLSAAECGDSVGIARSSARRYLEYLTDSGAAAVRHRYGSAGRPERRYQVADQ